MWKRLKRTLFSQNGMMVVNALFLLALFIRGRMLSFLAYSVWLAFLIYSFRKSESRGSKVIYACFGALAALNLVINLYIALFPR